MQEQGIELAVSTVVFALRPHPETGEQTLWLPLVRRIRQPHEGRWALPGGPLQPDEDLAASARRTLERTTGLTSQYLEQLYSFGEPDRSPQRVVSIVYWALVRSDEAALTVDGDNVEWFVADEVAAAGLRPQRDRPVRTQPAPGQDHLLPDRPVLPQSRVHPRRGPRGPRSRAAQEDRPRQLPPSGPGDQDVGADRHPADGHQPSPPGRLPIPARSR